VRKEIFTSFCFGLIFFGGFFAEKATALTRTVDTTSDNGALTACTGAANDCSLRGAIAASAASGDTINFDGGVFGSAQTIQVTTTLTINKSLTILGPNSNLLTIARTGAAAFFVFTLQTGNIELRDLKITNGSGGIDNPRATTTLTRVVITANAGPGLAISPGGNVTVNDSTISSNNAVQGGGIFLLAEALGEFSKATVNRSTISGNTASQNGGGIYNNGILFVSNSTISGNSATNGGGGIYAPGNSFDGKGGWINYSTITNNQTGSLGGGGILSFNARRVFLTNSIVAGNSNSGNGSPDILNNIESGGYNLVGNTTGSGGYIATDKINVMQCTSPAVDAANPASFFPTDQRDGARTFNALPDIGAVELNCVANSNNAGDGSLREAISDAPFGGTVNFNPTFFNQSRTISLGGGVLDVFKNLTVNGPGSANLTIDGENSSRVFNIDGATLNLNGLRLTRGFPGSNVSGGAILINTNGILNASNVTIDNSRAYYGAGIHVVGTLNLSDSTISNCTADYAGGAVFFNGNASTVTRSNISNNHAETLGGGLGNSGILIIRNSTISGNTATRPPNSGDTPLGGGIYNDGALFNRKAVLDGYSDIRNSTIVFNSAIQTGNGGTPDGGAIFADSNHTGGITATVDAKSVTLVGNSAVGSGGGIFMNQFSGNHSIFNLENSIIAGNVASNAPDISGQITSYGYNLITNLSGSSWSPSSPSLDGNIFNPPGGVRLAPLGNYGGLTQTMALLPNSPALDAGNPNNQFVNDQRGGTRPIGGRGDIGAFERSVVFNQPSVPPGHQNSTYNQQLSAIRLTSLAEFEQPNTTEIAPTQFSIVPIGGQALPPGISLSPTGLLSGTPTTQGNYTFTVKATDTDGITGVQQYSLSILAPTAAGVSVSGRVLSGKVGIPRAVVAVTDAAGTVRTVKTNSFGVFRIDGLPAGQTFIFSVTAKGYQFAPRIVTVVEDIAELNLTADE
jgi:hypothetical protein